MFEIRNEQKWNFQINNVKEHLLQVSLTSSTMAGYELQMIA